MFQEVRLAVVSRGTPGTLTVTCFRSSPTPRPSCEARLGAFPLLSWVEDPRWQELRISESADSKQFLAKFAAQSCRMKSDKGTNPACRTLANCQLGKRTEADVLLVALHLRMTPKQGFAILQPPPTKYLFAPSPPFSGEQTGTPTRARQHAATGCSEHYDGVRSGP